MLFECDLQTVLATFIVEKNKISDLKLYVPEFFPVTDVFKWHQVNDPKLERELRESVATHLTIRRIKP